MDIIDNLIYATGSSTINSALNIFVPSAAPTPPTVPAQANRISSDFIPPYFPLSIPPGAGTGFSYSLTDKMVFCAYQDTSVIESTIVRHWYDIDDQVNYDIGGRSPVGTVAPLGGVRLTSFGASSTYHLITAYLLENTRMLQIFERLLERYMVDEDFGISDNIQVIDWLQNSERLFFKNDTHGSSNLRSLLRPNADDSRRNAYWRMFGMDLAFGDINSQAATSFHRARTANQEFIPLFEKYLTEVWQGYINARNTAGTNTADINNIVDLATQLREILIARRGNVNINTYAYLNLSREEFSSVLITSWFSFILSHNSPVVNFLNCQSSTIGERLLKIGAKVGIPAHSKCQSLFEIAAAAGSILTTIETNTVLANPGVMQTILSSLNPGSAAPQVLVDYMNNFLTIINNWEKATGHRLKNPEANIRGTVNIATPSRGPQAPSVTSQTQPAQARTNGRPAVTPSSN